MNNELFTGYARLTFTRYTDANGNVGAWKFLGVGKAGYNTGLANPYLYTSSGKAVGVGGKIYKKITHYDDSGRPKVLPRPYMHSYKTYKGEELADFEAKVLAHKESWEKYKEWEANRPITGYTETVHVAVKATAIISEGTFDDIVCNL